MLAESVLIDQNEVLFSLAFLELPNFNVRVEGATGQLVVEGNELAFLYVLVVSIENGETVELEGLVELPDPNAFVSATGRDPVLLLAPAHVFHLAFVSFEEVDAVEVVVRELVDGDRGVEACYGEKRKPRTEGDATNRFLVFIAYNLHCV